MPPKVVPIADQLIEALKNDAVAEALGKALAPFITLSVQESVTEISNSIKMLVTENRNLNDKVMRMEGENKDLHTRLAAAENKLEAVERDRRSCNIIIKGLHEGSFAERGSENGSDNGEGESQGSVTDTVVEMINRDLHLDIGPGDIGAAFRLKAGGKDKVRPILVKFTSKRARDSILKAKKILKQDEKPIFIYEHLTKEASELFYKTRKLVRDKKIHSTWTRNGQVFIKESSDEGSRPVRIVSATDLPR